jgi:hypothetical protein
MLEVDLSLREEVLVTSRIDRSHQWRLALTRATSAFLLGMTLSGLSLWLPAFRLGNQIQVLLYTLAGTLLFQPVSSYLLSHRLFSGATR